MIETAFSIGGFAEEYFSGNNNPHFLVCSVAPTALDNNR